MEIVEPEVSRKEINKNMSNIVIQVRSTCLAIFLFLMNLVGGNLPVIVSPLRSYFDDYRSLFFFVIFVKTSSFFPGLPCTLSGLVSWPSLQSSSCWPPSLSGSGIGGPPSSMRSTDRRRGRELGMVALVAVNTQMRNHLLK